MANIGRRSTAAELIRGDAHRGSYGDHLYFQRDGDAVVLVTEDDRILARGEGDANVVVHLAELDPITVPYVNAFIAHTGQKAWKNWRTKTYRLVPIDKSVPSDAQAIDADQATAELGDIDVLSRLSLAAPADPSQWPILRSIAVALYRLSVEQEQASRATQPE